MSGRPGPPTALPLRFLSDLFQLEVISLWKPPGALSAALGGTSSPSAASELFLNPPHVAAWTASASRAGTAVNTCYLPARGLSVTSASAPGFRAVSAPQQAATPDPGVPEACRPPWVLAVRCCCFISLGLPLPLGGSSHVSRGGGRPARRGAPVHFADFTRLARPGIPPLGRLFSKALLPWRPDHTFLFLKGSVFPTPSLAPLLSFSFRSLHSLPAACHAGPDALSPAGLQLPPGSPRLCSHGSRLFLGVVSHIHFHLLMARSSSNTLRYK